MGAAASIIALSRRRRRSYSERYLQHFIVFEYCLCNYEHIVKTDALIRKGLLSYLGLNHISRDNSFFLHDLLPRFPRFSTHGEAQDADFSTPFPGYSLSDLAGDREIAVANSEIIELYHV